MPRWIDANSAQRFAIYTLPAARKELPLFAAAKDEMRAAVKPVIDAHRADPSNRTLRRRARAAITEWMRLCEAEHYCRAVVAKGAAR